METLTQIVGTLAAFTATIYYTIQVVEYFRKLKKR
jgi:hypothetical protein